MPAPRPGGTGPRLGAVQMTSSPEGDRPDLAESSAGHSAQRTRLVQRKGRDPPPGEEEDPGPVPEARGAGARSTLWGLCGGQCSGSCPWEASQHLGL